MAVVIEVLGVTKIRAILKREDVAKMVQRKKRLSIPDEVINFKRVQRKDAIQRHPPTNVGT